MSDHDFRLNCCSCEEFVDFYPHEDGERVSCMECGESFSSKQIHFVELGVEWDRDEDGVLL